MAFLRDTSAQCSLSLLHYNCTRVENALYPIRHLTSTVCWGSCGYIQSFKVSHFIFKVTYGCSLPEALVLSVSFKFRLFCIWLNDMSIKRVSVCKTQFNVIFTGSKKRKLVILFFRTLSCPHLKWIQECLSYKFHRAFRSL